MDVFVLGEVGATERAFLAAFVNARRLTVG